MKSALATIVIFTAILTLAAGGFVMANMRMGNHANCLAAIPGSAPCAPGMDPLQFAITHMNALLGALLGIAGSLASAFFSVLVLFAWLSIPGAPKDSLINAISSRVYFEKTADSITKQRYWMSLHERRDPLLSFAASR